MFYLLSRTRLGRVLNDADLDDHRIEPFDVFADDWP